MDTSYDQARQDDEVRAIHYMMRDIQYRPWNTEVASLLSHSVTNICGSKTGDLVGQFAPTAGWVCDIQGRRAQVTTFPAAIDQMRAWSWVV